MYLHVHLLSISMHIIDGYPRSLSRREQLQGAAAKSAAAVEAQYDVLRGKVSMIGSSMVFNGIL